MQHHFNCYRSACTNMATDVREKRLGDSIWAETANVSFCRLFLAIWLSIDLSVRLVSFFFSLPFQRRLVDEAKRRRRISRTVVNLMKSDLNILIPSSLILLFSTLFLLHSSLSLFLSLSIAHVATRPSCCSARLSLSLSGSIDGGQEQCLDICRNKRLKYKHSSPGVGGRASERANGGKEGEKGLGRVATGEWTAEGEERWRDCEWKKKQQQ